MKSKTITIEVTETSTRIRRVCVDVPIDFDGHTYEIEDEVRMLVEIGKKYGRISTRRLRGNNFMTPDFVGVFTNKKVTFELSKGLGFNREPIIGVTFFEPNNEHNACCSSPGEVEELLNKVIHTKEELDEQLHSVGMVKD